MLILTLRTDKPDAEIAVYEDNKRVSGLTWLAHRELAETIHLKIKDQLDIQGKEITDINGLTVYKGPGSFTGLRIGLTVANALAYTLDIPIVSETGEGWEEKGIKRLLNGENESISLPEYGALPNITKPRK
jgi:tRNA threonylcarbamoyladenosine biosynthesis protein TsaB